MRREKKKKNSEQGDTQEDLSVSILFKDLKSSMIAIGFKGNMKSAAELINRITWINYFTEIEEVYAGRGSASANFLIKLRVFYREQADE